MRLVDADALLKEIDADYSADEIRNIVSNAPTIHRERTVKDTLEKVGHTLAISLVAHNDYDSLKYATEQTVDAIRILIETCEPVAKQTPYKNCQFTICDLPGQCKNEGKCHHPAYTSPQPREWVGLSNADISEASMFRNGTHIRILTAQLKD